jgi:dTDP-4-dehydrorhamnose 3,5-epimerase
VGRLSVEATPIAGHWRVRSTAVVDERGQFSRLFCVDELAALHPSMQFPQVNLSATHRRGTVRGLHWQAPPAAEAKLIRCLRGRVFDVAVDLRAGSPTFLRWHATELSADGHAGVLIPEGVAHGFQALTDDVELLYLHTQRWSPEHERVLRHDDPRLAIAWPLPVVALSPRDAAAPMLDADFAGVAP